MKKGTRISVWIGANNTTISRTQKEGFRVRPGTIKSVRSGKARVRFDDDPSAEYSIDQSFLQLFCGPDPLMEEVMAEDIGGVAPYSVRGYKTHMGMEGYGFNAKLYKHGAKVADVLNEGSGGCNFYYFTSRAEETAFHAACKALCEATGYDACEAMDAVVDWIAEERPNGITWRASVAKFNDDMAAIMSRKV
jgi:hypothetical protein